MGLHTRVKRAYRSMLRPTEPSVLTSRALAGCPSDRLLARRSRSQRLLLRVRSARRTPESGRGPAARDPRRTVCCPGGCNPGTALPRSERVQLGSISISSRSRPVGEVGQGVDNGSAEHVAGRPAANCPVAVEGPTVQSQRCSRFADFQELRQDGVKRSRDFVPSFRVRHRDRSGTGKGTEDVETRRQPKTLLDPSSGGVGQWDCHAANRSLMIVTSHVPQRVPTDLPAMAPIDSCP